VNNDVEIRSFAAKDSVAVRDLFVRVSRLLGRPAAAEQRALRIAFSRYNTGSAVGGFSNGYVTRVVAAARYVPEIGAPCGRGPKLGHASKVRRARLAGVWRYHQRRGGIRAMECLPAVGRAGSAGGAFCAGQSIKGGRMNRVATLQVLRRYGVPVLVLAAWRLDYNTVRPHSSIGNLAPADYAKLGVPASQRGRDAALNRGLRAPSRCSIEPERLRWPTLLIDG
jgi:Integrase core domain